VQDLVLVASKDHAKADNNDQIEFWVDLTDASGTLTSDGGDKALEFQPSGVGHPPVDNRPANERQRDNIVPANECISRVQRIVS